MYVLASNMWFQTLIRTFFFALDKVVFGFIPRIYNLLMSIARTSILSQATIADMADRIYKLLAVFMIFKVTFSLIMYVVNPDDFSDKSKGISKLVTNIVFSLLILILTPYIFRYAYQFQTIILEDNSLATLIFGENGESSSNVLAGAGDSIAYTTMIPFFSPDTSLVSSCTNIVEQSSTGQNTINSKCFGYKINDDGTFGNADSSQTTLASIAKTSDDFDEAELKNYAIGIVSQNFHSTFRLDIATAKTESQFVINYNYVISTVVGVVVCLILVSFCLDVAMRSIKLSFLQLIAPIPILSYIDPKSGKDGMFKKWYQMCLKTFASLFLKLLALYFAIYIIGRINGISDIITGEYQSSTLVKIFIIIGVLMFAKSFTKILEGLGIKLDEKFHLNPIKKFEDQALGGKGITGAMGGLMAAVPDRVARMATAPGWKNKVKSGLGAIPGLFGGAIRGASSNAGFTGGRDKQAEFNRRLREGRINGLSSARSYLDYVGSKYGLDDATLEKRKTIDRMNKDNIDKKEREIEAMTQSLEMGKNELNQSSAPIKSLKTRRENVKNSAEKLMNAAEALASKKADLGVDAKEVQALNLMRDNIGKKADEESEFVKLGLARAGETITSSTIARAEKYINRRNYTTNRNADAANLEFLNQNQGVTLDRTIVMGEGKAQYVIEEGTVIDGNVIAQAKAAQGKYLKQSKKAVFNELAKGEDSAYNKNGTDGELKEFTNYYEEYDKSKEIANQETDEYNGKHDEKIDGFTIDKDRTITTYDSKGEEMTGFDRVDATSNEIKYGDDTVKISGELSATESKVETINREIEQIKNNATVDYYDEDGKLIKDGKIVEAKQFHKTHSQETERQSKIHDLRRQFGRNTRWMPPGGGGKK